MATKRFRGRTCAYCSAPGVATVGEHVLARAFVPKGPDRNNLPKVPACVPCNTAKERLEDYAQVVAVLGGRHDAAVVNAASNLERKARLRPQHMLALTRTIRPAWERTLGGVMLPTGAVTVDPIRMRDFLHLLVRGLFYHHTGAALPLGTAVESQMTERDRESILVDRTQHAFGPDVQRVKADLGNGILRYEALISRVVPGLSAWQIEFAKLQWAIGRDTPRSLVSRRFTVTMPQPASLDLDAPPAFHAEREHDPDSAER